MFEPHVFVTCKKSGKQALFQRAVDQQNIDYVYTKKSQFRGRAGFFRIVKDGKRTLFFFSIARPHSEYPGRCGHVERWSASIFSSTTDVLEFVPECLASSQKRLTSGHYSIAIAEAGTGESPMLELMCVFADWRYSLLEEVSLSKLYCSFTEAHFKVHKPGE